MREDYERMFGPYDIVQCYATEPIGALVGGKRPYVAFEHGTLRDFTMGDNRVHRLNALAYREADHVFITNGDCLEYAQKLGIERFTPMIHPVDVDQHRQDFAEDAQRICEELDAEVLIYCPVRHDYAIKGTDRAIEALPLIKNRTGKRVVMILTTWGPQVAESRAKVEALGCPDNVTWRDSMCRIAMIKHMQGGPKAHVDGAKSSISLNGIIRLHPSPGRPLTAETSENASRRPVPSRRTATWACAAWVA